MIDTMVTSLNSFVQRIGCAVAVCIFVGTTANSQPPNAEQIRTPPRELKLDPEKISNGKLDRMESYLQALKKATQALEKLRKSDTPAAPAEPKTKDDVEGLYKQIQSLLGKIRNTKRQRSTLPKAQHSEAPLDSNATSNISIDSNPPDRHTPAASNVGSLLLLARKQFSWGQYADSLETFESIPLGKLTSEQKANVNYFRASCNRFLGHLDKARPLYREAANLTSDSVFKQIASWQIRSVDWQKQIGIQFEQMQRKLESKAK